MHAGRVQVPHAVLLVSFATLLLAAASLAGCTQRATGAKPGGACAGLDPGSCLADASCTLTSCPSCCGQPIQRCAAAGEAPGCPACDTDCSDRCSGIDETSCRAQPSCLPIICPCQGSDRFAGCVDPRLQSVPPCGTDCRPISDGGTPDSSEPPGDGGGGGDGVIGRDRGSDADFDCHTLDPGQACLDAADKGCHPESCPACAGQVSKPKCLNPGQELNCPAVACLDCSQLDESTCWNTADCQPDYCTGCNGRDAFGGCLPVNAVTSCAVVDCPDPGCTDAQTCDQNPSCHLVIDNGQASCVAGSTVNCDTSGVFCNETAPSCDGDQSAVVVAGCWAGCVDTSACAP